MNARPFVCLALAFSVLACSASSLPDAETPVSNSAPAMTAKKVAKKPKATRPSRVAEPPPTVGDTFVRHYSGTFRNSPLTLTEKVVAVDNDSATLEYTLTDGPKTERLRVRRGLKDQSPLGVWQIHEEQETVVGVYVLHEMLAKTSFAPDSNQATLGETEETCMVGQQELQCQTTKYQVLVAGQPATLTVSQSAELPGGDLGGSIVDDSGRVLYRAELVEMTRGSGASIASRGPLFVPEDL